jgi:hypothetical protein
LSNDTNQQHVQDNLKTEKETLCFRSMKKAFVKGSADEINMSEILNCEDPNLRRKDGA